MKLKPQTNAALQLAALFVIWALGMSYLFSGR